VIIAYGALLMVGAFLGYRRFVARVEAQVAAREALETLEEALESVGEAFGLFDAAGHPIFLNARYRMLFDSRSDGLNPGDEIVQQLGDHWLRSSARLTASGKRVHVHADVTELKRTEDALREARDAAEQASRAKSQFLATMSHELRTPLNAIIGFAEMLITQPDLDGDKQREYAATIRQAGRHLLSLLNDILDLSRIEAGAYQLDLTPLRLVDVVEEVIEMMAGELRAGNLSTAVEIGGDVIVEADERALRQIFINLVGNAIKFTPPGGRITVTAHAGDDEVEVTVADTGEGIAAADLKRVLEPFVQGEDAMNRRHGGAGLGLPLVKRLVELQGGRFRLESTRGVGTRAIFTLKRADM
ncbi:MAG: sensor histidine kinase, partial [Alphaproteobacteria bacterium]